MALKSKDIMYEDKFRLWKLLGHALLPKEQVLELMQEYLDAHSSYACDDGKKWGIGHWCTVCLISDKCEFMKDEKKRIALELNLKELAT